MPSTTGIIKLPLKHKKGETIKVSIKTISWDTRKKKEKAILWLQKKYYKNKDIMAKLKEKETTSLSNIPIKLKRSPKFS